LSEAYIESVEEEDDDNDRHVDDIKGFEEEKDGFQI
jgi:hypothetical protein